MEIILAVATILGGLAALLYFVENLRNAGGRKTKAPATHTESSRSDIIFPPEAAEAVAKKLPGWRLPATKDLRYEWEEQFDTSSLAPLLCRGNFLGDRRTALAFFVLENDGEGYQVVVAVLHRIRGIEVFPVTQGKTNPRTMYVQRVAPGIQPIGESVWKHGGPKQVEIPTDGIIVGSYESASCLYYWSSSSERFLEQWLTD